MTDVAYEKGALFLIALERAVGRAKFDAFLRDVVAEDEQRRVRLSDVAGLNEVKRRLELSFLGPLRVPELRAQFRRGLRGKML